MTQPLPSLNMGSTQAQLERQYWNNQVLRIHPDRPIDSGWQIMCRDYPMVVFQSSFEYSEPPLKAWF